MAGSVAIDGIDLRLMARADFRQAIALVPQDPVIFATTARENIRFGRPAPRMPRSRPPPVPPMPMIS